MRDNEVFDHIAPGWYGFRHRTIFPRELERLRRRWSQGRLLNLGCGHGADFLPFRDGFELYGVDFSPGMLRLAEKYAKKHGLRVSLTLADIVALPYPDASFDWAVAVATYHHLRTGADRLQALRELRRVLRPGGEAFITVWNRCQPRFWFRGRDVEVPWRSGGRVFKRFYHLFTYGELEGLVRKAGLEVLESAPEAGYRFPLKWFSRNITLLVRRV